MKQKRKYKHGEYRLTKTGRYIIGIGIPGILSLTLLFSMVAIYPNEAPDVVTLIALHFAISFGICVITGMELSLFSPDKRLLQLFENPLWIVMPVLFFSPIIFIAYIVHGIIIEKVE